MKRDVRYLSALVQSVLVATKTTANNRSRRAGMLTSRWYSVEVRKWAPTKSSRTTALKISVGLVRLWADFLDGDRLLMTAEHLPVYLLVGVPAAGPLKKSP